MHNLVIVVLAQIVCKPNVFAALLIPNMDTPSIVEKHNFDSEKDDKSLPKNLQIICKHAIPHCILSC